MNNEVYVGVDVHEGESQIAVLNKDGELIGCRFTESLEPYGPLRASLCRIYWSSIPGVPSKVKYLHYNGIRSEQGTCRAVYEVFEWG